MMKPKMMADYQFLGICDKLRTTESGETNWQKMIQSAVRVSNDLFINHCQAAPILDEDETIKDWLDDRLREDESSATYYSYWGSDRCVYFQTCGFEYIFLQVL